MVRRAGVHRSTIKDNCSGLLVSDQVCDEMDFNSFVEETATALLSCPRPSTSCRLFSPCRVVNRGAPEFFTRPRASVGDHNQGWASAAASAEAIGLRGPLK